MRKIIFTSLFVDIKGINRGKMIYKIQSLNYKFPTTAKTIAELLYSLI